MHAGIWALIIFLALIAVWVVLAKLGAIKYLKRKLFGKKVKDSREEEPIAASVSGTNADTPIRTPSKTGRYANASEV